MGREIRRVPPDWTHPVNKYCPHIGNNPHDGGPCYHPLHDQDYESAAQEWEAKYTEFTRMTPDERYNRYSIEIKHYWEWSAPPDEEFYRKERWTPEEATGYQVYENVSEGTPVSPVFETEDAMRIWLVAQGHSEYATDQFIKAGWAPSMLMQEGRGCSGLGIDSYDFLKEDKP